MQLLEHTNPSDEEPLAADEEPGEADEEPWATPAGEIPWLAEANYKAIMDRLTKYYKQRGIAKTEGQLEEAWQSDMLFLEKQKQILLDDDLLIYMPNRWKDIEDIIHFNHEIEVWELRKQTDPDARPPWWTEQLEAEQQEMSGEEEPPAECTTANKQPLFQAMSQLLHNVTAPEYLVHGLIEKNTDVLLVGQPGSGKSFVALDIAIGVVTGGSTLAGRTCGQGAVMCLVGEGLGGFQRRGQAAIQQRGLKIEDLDDLFLSSRTIPLDDAGVRELLAEAKALKASGRDVALVIVDTVARHLVGEENSAAEVGAYIRNTARLREVFPGCTLIHVHHSGHGPETQMRGRGSSALPAAADTVLVCARGELTTTKCKDGEAPPPLEFKLQPIQIGMDDNREPITSCTVAWGERSQRDKASAVGKLSKVEVHGLKTLRQAIEQAGAAFVDALTWRFEFFRSYWLDSSDSKRKAFDRARASLVASGLISVEFDKYGMTSDGPGKNPDMSGQMTGGKPDGHGHTPIGVSVCPNPVRVPMAIDEGDLL